MSTSEKRPKDISNRHLSASFTRQVSEPKHKIPKSSLAVAGYFYKPTPPPETVVVHSVPKKTNDACCWGCAAALCLCFGLEECCSS
ncbi:uncharacterized protein EV154DRAFT_17339 [Mucor mucedo]|uniref:uncharacterized protein n=1 Tax=Mucor mucedo TaxID=29922 RepID=UPI00221FFD6E|nr:uncharacterized protein EV154DRAFT_17339 [Mucor mucedo]KAI7886364.1 hypothetical protein EV154DRAFT_17339 [Mucor mucedo]